MLRRLVLWLKRLFGGSSDNSPVGLPAPEDAQETTKSEKMEVISCEVVSISFDDDEDDKHEHSNEEIPEDYYDFEV